MTSLSKDRRNLRPNRMKRLGRCVDCGKVVYIYFAVPKCDGCLGEVTESLEDCRKDRPSMVRYQR